MALHKLKAVFPVFGLLKRKRLTPNNVIPEDVYYYAIKYLPATQMIGPGIWHICLNMRKVRQ